MTAARIHTAVVVAVVNVNCGFKHRVHEIFCGQIIVFCIWQQPSFLDLQNQVVSPSLILLYLSIRLKYIHQCCVMCMKLRCGHEVLDQEIRAQHFLKRCQTATNHKQIFRHYFSNLLFVNCIVMGYSLNISSTIID